MNFKKSQSGRSMVEMLGVLAIIGVLSVGGIAGYSLSMRRHRANQIADSLSKYALIAYSHCQQKILTGDITDFSECTSETIPTFRDTDIPEIKNAGLYPDGGDGSGIYFESIKHNNTSGTDKVTISVMFTHPDKLCQALGAISGFGCTGSGSVRFEFIQN